MFELKLDPLSERCVVMNRPSSTCAANQHLTETLQAVRSAKKSTIAREFMSQFINETFA
jgi:hypothetical protein